jgi:phenylpropionate dioxygenase-like ring-hydroxylating dioxygenase large terminal subunit
MTDQATPVHIRGLTEAEAAGIEVFEKPAPGSWTESFGLDTGPVSLADSFDPQFYELEKEAVFRRSWLNLGRVEQLPRRGAYFTKELKFLGTSILVVRGMDDQIRAFHNVCSHRGNRLLWDDYPDRETKGTCRALSCKYHGWRYGLDGEVQYVHNAQEFFDLQADELTLPKVHLDTWAGFIWINLEETPSHSLRDFLTPTVAKLESYPFEKMTQTYVFESEVEANWKLYVDAFQEVYHVPYVHGKLNNPAAEATGIDKIPFMVPFFQTYGKHRLFTSVGPLGNVNLRVRKAADALFQAGLLGTDHVPDVGPLGEGINPGGIDRWGVDSWQLYPNFVLVTWNRNHYFTYHYWPLSPTRHKFVWTVNFVPPTTTRERLAQEHAAMVIREGGLQDAATLEATQMGISSDARQKFFLCDQEVAIRHLHHVVQQDVSDYAADLAARKDA